jgi:hypothetical protein
MNETLESLFTKAMRSGLITSRQMKALGPKSVLELILDPRFSQLLYRQRRRTFRKSLI